MSGRPPGTFACGYCHLPSGQGRPENAALAGFPVISGRLHRCAGSRYQIGRAAKRVAWRAVPPGGSHARRGSKFHRGRAPCASCHSKHLQGVDLIPPLAGRSPTYLLRQLVAFKTKDRAGSAAAPMQAVVAALGMRDMIAVAAYAAAIKN